MSKNFDYSSKEVSLKIEKALKSAEKIGEGHNGVVFLFKDGKTIKFFRRHSAWQDEAYILQKVKGSKFFPKIIEVGDNYIVRDYVDGIRLDKYLRTNKIDKYLARSLYEMILEFERLKFRRLDIRCKDIFYNIEEKRVKIIDPKNNYSKKVSYPRHLMKGLYKKNALDEFLMYILKFDRKKGKVWREKIDTYISTINEEFEKKE
ncbi:MAG: hypothetical protein ACRC57_01300 [Sarcina sp.]